MSVPPPSTVYIGATLVLRLWSQLLLVEGDDLLMDPLIAGVGNLEMRQMNDLPWSTEVPTTLLVMPQSPQSKDVWIKGKYIHRMAQFSQLREMMARAMIEHYLLCAAHPIPEDYPHPEALLAQTADGYTISDAELLTMLQHNRPSKPQWFLDLPGDRADWNQQSRVIFCFGVLEIHRLEEYRTLMDTLCNNLRRMRAALADTYADSPDIPLHSGERIRRLVDMNYAFHTLKGKYFWDIHPEQAEADPSHA